MTSASDEAGAVLAWDVTRSAQSVLGDGLLPEAVIVIEPTVDISHERVVSERQEEQTQFVDMQNNTQFSDAVVYHFDKQTNLQTKTGRETLRSALPSFPIVLS